MSVAELDVKHRELSDRLAAKQEAKHPLNRGDAVADEETFSHYCKAAYWTAQEAAALFVQRNPERLTKSRVENDRNPPKIAVAFARTLELIERAMAMGEIDRHSSPLKLLEWANTRQIAVPPELERILRQLGQGSDEGQVSLEALKAENERLADALKSAELDYHREKSDHGATYNDFLKQLTFERREQLNTVIAMNEEADKLRTEIAALRRKAGDGEQLSTRERSSLLKLVIAMAIKKYNYRPSMSKNSAPANIATALRELGMALDEDTIRKYLNEAKALLPGGLPE